MDKSIRIQRQTEAIEAWMYSNRRAIVKAAPRFGKIRVALSICQELRYGKVLVLLPRNDIKSSWINESKLVQYSGYMDFVTFTSIKKLTKKYVETYNLVVIDEPHELSSRQISMLEHTLGSNIPILGLTGTMTKTTEKELYLGLGIDVCYNYSIDEAVKDGILCDYSIYVHEVFLDDNQNNALEPFKGAVRLTEYQEFKRWSKVAVMSPNAAKFMDLKRIGLLQNSIAKKNKTLELLQLHDNQRVLVFCGTKKIANGLGIPTYHSGSQDKEVFNQFCNGDINKLATIRLLQSGVTIKPIDLGIMNYISGAPEASTQKICRFLGFEYNNPEKKAKIHIISSNEPFETERIKTGLQFLDSNKINYIKYDKSNRNIKRTEEPGKEGSQ